MNHGVPCGREDEYNDEYNLRYFDLRYFDRYDERPGCCVDQPGFFPHWAMFQAAL